MGAQNAEVMLILNPLEKFHSIYDHKVVIHLLALCAKNLCHLTFFRKTLLQYFPHRFEFRIKSAFLLPKYNYFFSSSYSTFCKLSVDLLFNFFLNEGISE
jgi:hypothetical protein